MCTLGHDLVANMVVVLGAWLDLVILEGSFNLSIIIPWFEDRTDLAPVLQQQALR